jgi:hypothetical protein
MIRFFVFELEIALPLCFAITRDEMSIFEPMTEFEEIPTNLINRKGCVAHVCDDLLSISRRDVDEVGFLPHQFSLTLFESIVSIVRNTNLELFM